MEPLILKDPGIFPDEPVLRQALQESWPAYGELTDQLPRLDILPEWRYYRDGQSWLCKLLWKKKNLGWLVVFDGYFRVTCYFLERHMEAIDALDIDPAVKEEFYRQKPSGKLIPMTVAVRDEELPGDIVTMLEFKKKAK